ncbi:charged multivesicular body protein 7-like [Musca domestica]|uniref:Charged multivesicular body protein 7-like n=1 Tax=Musca domestica TaxID=7370 RepID=T1PHM1_MUSDO|nr:charged multivesicular body protein 7-like [Musca domestica]
MSSVSSKSQGAKSPKQFQLPAVLNDELRAQALYAPFRERSVNPENYDSKMKFWKDIILEFCLHRGTSTFSKYELLQTFSIGQRVPSCLDTVIGEMQRSGLIRPRLEYEYDPSNGWTGWAVLRFWKNPLHKIKNAVLSPNSAQQDHMFVHLTAMKKYCKDLQAIFENPPFSGAIFCYEELKNSIFASTKMSEDCLVLCLQTLSCQNKIGLHYRQNVDGNNNQIIHLVKIPSASHPSVIINESDIGLHNLHTTRQLLLKQLENLEFQVAENEEKARQYIKENKRLLAKTYLRKKHLLEKSHAKRSDALHNIESLMSNLDDAKHNGVILDAYKYGTKALQEILKSSNLTYDNVEEIVSDLRETIDTNSDLQEIIAKTSTSECLSTEEEDELERELKGLFADQAAASSPIIPGKAPANDSQITQPQKIEISDAELIAMLDELEVEQKTPANSFSVSEATI